MIFTRWYAGAGVDMFVTRFASTDLILGVEYQHVDLGTQPHLTTLFVGGQRSNDRNVGFTDEVVRAKFTFKWNPAVPVVAKY